MAHTVDEYGNLLKNLLPPGAAFPREPGTDLEKVLLGIAAELSRLESRADTLAIEVNPLDTIELLPDWERAAGLPDKCAGTLEETLQGRRNALIAKLNATGGQSIEYFIAIAAQLGYVITIETFRPFQVGISKVGDALTNGGWLYAWRIHAPEQSIITFKVGLSKVGEALRTWGNDTLECKIRQLAPAHTVPIFAYDSSSLDLLFDSGTYLLNQQSSTFGALITFARSTTGGRWNQAGVYESVAINQPRFDFDPVTHQPLGLLIEESRTNLHTYSEDFSNAAWGKSLGTITVPGGSCPIGVIHKFVENNTNGNHFLQRAFTATAGVAYISWRVLKAGERDLVRAQLFNTGSQADFDLSAGTVTGNGTITPLSDGWFLCAITGTYAAGGSVTDRWYPKDAGGNATYTGDGVSGYYVAAGQLEVGSFNTSYIPTTALAVTRGADVASINSIANWYNQVSGSMLVVSNDRMPTPSGTFAVSLGSDGSNYIGMGYTTPGSAAATTFVRNAGAGTSVLDAAQRSKFASSWDTVNVDLASDGEYRGQSAHSGLPAVTGLFIGRGHFGGATVNCHIKQIRYYPRRLTNAELTNLTAP